MKIQISAVTMKMIAERAKDTLITTDRIELPDGSWEISISSMVYNFLTQNKLEGETLDDTIQRLLLRSNPQ